MAKCLWKDANRKKLHARRNEDKNKFRIQTLLSPLLSKDSKIKIYKMFTLLF